MKAKLNKHYWAMTKELNPELIVVLCTAVNIYGDASDFAVCGPWECGISPFEIILLKEIKPPAGHGHVPLYYGDYEQGESK